MAAQAPTVACMREHERLACSPWGRRVTGDGADSRLRAWVGGALLDRRKALAVFACVALGMTYSHAKQKHVSSEALASGLQSAVIGLEEGTLSVQAATELAVLLLGTLRAPTGDSPMYTIRLGDREVGSFSPEPEERDGRRWRLEVTVDSLPRYQVSSQSTTVTFVFGENGEELTNLLVSSSAHIHDSEENAVRLHGSSVVTGGYLSIGKNGSLWCQEVCLWSANDQAPSGHRSFLKDRSERAAFRRKAARPLSETSCQESEDSGMKHRLGQMALVVPIASSSVASGERRAMTA